ncbi:Retrovirus-related Pol poly from transposon [Paramuricea clavata]|uniref:Retrovirus-related Pol poly from transposon n=1 Tax=Paramuricea clavata TaxID=317549 RepID=A0A6S7H1H9_PARCT|nr:Retrovirus-related Pol poly from transposon [Paramuricea clavata]
MRADLLRLSHNDPSSGHMGINRCVERLQPWYYWPGMTSEVHLWVAECDVCNQRKSSSASHRSPMENIRVSQPMELWAMDILGPLPITAQGHQYVLVMSDHFTKWVEAVPMADQKAETVARAFIDNVVSRHGVPVKLLTDQGRNFESELMKEVFKLLGVHKLRTSPYYPQTDGQVERFNRTLKAIISSYVNGHHNDWDLHLPLALFAYRTSVHSSTRVFPFKAVYGRDATTPLVLLGSTENPKTRLIAHYCAELEFTLKEVHATVAEEIKKAQTRQNQNYDARNTAHQTEIRRPGDIVWLHSTVISKGRSRKFHKPWIGPYVILRCQGRLNYVIRPKSGKGRSSCVHRNRLKLVQNQTDDINEQNMPSPLSTKSEKTQEQKEVEATNMVPLRRSTVPVSADHLIVTRTLI